MCLSLHQMFLSLSVFLCDTSVSLLRYLFVFPSLSLMSFFFSFISSSITLCVNRPLCQLRKEKSDLAHQLDTAKVEYQKVNRFLRKNI